MICVLSKVLEYLGGAVKFSFLWLLYSTASFPLPLRYVITDVLSFITLILCYSKRNSVRENLKSIFKREPTFAEILRVFVEYGRYWAEYPLVNKIWKSSTVLYHSQQFPPSEPCFLGVTFHMGNFELFGNIIKDTTRKELQVVAERLRPEYIADFFRRTRQSHGIRTVVHDDLRQILKVIKEGNPLGILCDRMVGGRGVEVRFFGKRVRMPLNIVSYALQKKIPVYVAYCIHKNGVLNVYSRKIGGESDFDTAVQTIVSTLEEAIVRFPFQWHVLSAL